MWAVSRSLAEKPRLGPREPSEQEDPGRLSPYGLPTGTRKHIDPRRVGGG